MVTGVRIWVWFRINTISAIVAIGTISATVFTGTNGIICAPLTTVANDSICAPLSPKGPLSKRSQCHHWSPMDLPGDSWLSTFPCKAIWPEVWGNNGLSMDHHCHHWITIVAIGIYGANGAIAAITTIWQSWPEHSHLMAPLLPFKWSPMVSTNGSSLALMAMGCKIGGIRFIAIGANGLPLAPF